MMEDDGLSKEGKSLARPVTCYQSYIHIGTAIDSL